LARRFGVSETELEGLAKGNLSGFGERERAALEFAEKLTVDSTRVADELFTALRQHFSEGETVEIAAVAGIFNYFNRVANALKIEPTR